MTYEQLIVEHPSGEFRSSLEAMTEAFRRIKQLGSTARWAVLSGQGQGGRLDSYRIAEVRFRNDEFLFTRAVAEIGSLTEKAGIDLPQIHVDDELRSVKISDATPVELARFLDSLYRERFDIRPHDGEHDYAFGAEWV